MRTIAFLLITLGCGATTMASEEPDYRVVQQHDEYEVRLYDPYVVAETVVSGDFRYASSEAFGRLFRYISGNNRRVEKIEMTSPVTSSEGQEIEMTVPVTSAASGSEDGGTVYRYQFVLPARLSLATAPQPADGRVTLRQVPARYVAALRYSGRSDEGRYRQHEDLLLEALADDGVAVAGEPLFARYDRPSTPSHLRRNEVLVEIER